MTLPGSGRIHFTGIGGAGMSAIAKVLLEQGRSVSGSDLKRARSLSTLEAIGAWVEIGHRAELVDGADAVIASSAVPPTNSELVRARELGIPVISRGEALAAILEGSRAIVVAGTHGKTTTTSMIVAVLRHAGIDATYLVGGGLNDVGTNARAGTSEISVAESDESDGSFLLLNPSIAVVTNVEADHMDHWRTFEALKGAFGSFIERVPRGGTVCVPGDDPFLRALAESSDAGVVFFGDEADVKSGPVTPSNSGVAFELMWNGRNAEIVLPTPGIHNVMNALAATSACVAAGVAFDDIVGGLNAFRGVERRFQVRGSTSQVTVIDDYAHHPTEVRATLAAARPGPWKRVVAVFQPHRYSRTAALHDEFGRAFADADVVVVTDVYGAGEEPLPGITGKLVADSVCVHVPGKTIAYLPHRDELVGYLCALARPGDALLTLGAGDVTTVGDEVMARLGQT
jgi:UDP-N-acetylmuramate--alanine ligase